MKFAEALALLEQGKKVSSTTLFDTGDYIGLNTGAVMAVYGPDGEWLDEVTIDAEFLATADFYEVPVIAEPISMYGYFNAEKGRWMSTSNPDGMRAKGVNVKLFEIVTREEG